MNLVFLHGWAAASRIWHWQQTAFQDRAHILAPDFPVWEAAWLTDYLRPLSMADTVLVGWSLGGMLALETLAQLAICPRALVLVGVAASFCRRPDFPWGSPPAVVRGLRYRLQSEPEKVVEEFAALCLSPGEASYRDELASLITTSVAPGFLAQGLDYLLKTDLRPWLPGLTGPVTIVHGDQDRVTPLSQAYFLKEHLLASHLDIFTAAGHLPFLTQATQFNALLTELLL